MTPIPKRRAAGFLSRLRHIRGFLLDEELDCFGILPREVPARPEEPTGELPPQVGKGARGGRRNGGLFRRLYGVEAAALRTLLAALDRRSAGELLASLSDAPSPPEGLLEDLRDIEQRVDDGVRLLDPGAATRRLLASHGISPKNWRRRLSGWLAGPPVQKLTPEARRRLARLDGMATGIRGRLLHGNLGLVIWVIRRHGRHRLPLPAAIREGAIGLDKAIRRYEPGRSKLGTFSYLWIRQAISRAAEFHADALRVPSHLQVARRCFVREYRRRPPDGRPAVPGRLRPLLSPVVTDGSTRPLPHFWILERLPDTEVPTPWDRVFVGSLSSFLDQALKELPPRYRKLFELRFGWGSSESHRLNEVGDHLGCSRERVRQLEAKIHQKLERRLRPALCLLDPKPGG